MRLKILDIEQRADGTSLTVEASRRDNRVLSRSAQYVRINQAESQFGEVDWEQFSQDLRRLDSDSAADPYTALKNIVERWQSELAR
ncbi:hypothetical protein OIT44_03835 [Weissella ceti]|uniref:Uncharacterized protein n=1 Tax=Weissella ceti TaxID=759620 RepID=A0ABT3E455_9LACO|nr:hypothetical protein [Weissella ceti]MCW0953204.1 hypothetical protein [Weissella ceti]QVK12721.1 hypothetical protein KHQ31_03595 [Weissella ceti]